MPAAMTAAMILSEAGLSTDRPVVANAYAALLTGPPRSKAIIRPRMIPRTIADEPDRPLSASCRPVVMAASGRPRTRNIRPPASSVAPSGITTTGIRPRAQVGTFSRLMYRAAKPASRPPTRPPRKPAPTKLAIAPTVKPGAMPGRSAMAYAM